LRAEVAYLGKLRALRGTGTRAKVQAALSLRVEHGLDMLLAAGKVVPNVLDRDFCASAPTEKWVTDVTEFRVGHQKLYLSPVMDLFDRQIILLGRYIAGSAADQQFPVCPDRGPR
jgi:transposase InsO family protein